MPAAGPAGRWCSRSCRTISTRCQSRSGLSTTAKSLITDANKQVRRHRHRGQGRRAARQGAQGRDPRLRRLRSERGDEAAVLADDAGDQCRAAAATPATASAWRRSSARSSGTCGTSTARMAFKHTDPDYPFAIRVKRFPDWIPGKEHLALVQTAWILVDKTGKRFMNELPPYVQDVGARPLERVRLRDADLPAHSGPHDLSTRPAAAVIRSAIRPTTTATSISPGAATASRRSSSAS